jgi:hypothetical protein
LFCPEVRQSRRRIAIRRLQRFFAIIGNDRSGFPTHCSARQRGYQFSCQRRGSPDVTCAPSNLVLQIAVLQPAEVRKPLLGTQLSELLPRRHCRHSPSGCADAAVRSPPVRQRRAATLMRSDTAWQEEGKIDLYF